VNGEVKLGSFVIEDSVTSGETQELSEHNAKDALTCDAQAVYGAGAQDQTVRIGEAEKSASVAAFEVLSIDKGGQEQEDEDKGISYSSVEEKSSRDFPPEAATQTVLAKGTASSTFSQEKAGMIAAGKHIVGLRAQAEAERVTESEQASQSVGHEANSREVLNKQMEVSGEKNADPSEKRTRRSHDLVDDRAGLRPASENTPQQVTQEDVLAVSRAMQSITAELESAVPQNIGQDDAIAVAAGQNATYGGAGECIVSSRNSAGTIGSAVVVHKTAVIARSQEAIQGSVRAEKSQIGDEHEASHTRLGEEDMSRKAIKEEESLIALRRRFETEDHGLHIVGDEDVFEFGQQPLEHVTAKQMDMSIDCAHVAGSLDAPSGRACGVRTSIDTPVPSEIEAVFGKAHIGSRVDQITQDAKTHSFETEHESRMSEQIMARERIQRSDEEQKQTTDATIDGSVEQHIRRDSDDSILSCGSWPEAAEVGIANSSSGLPSAVPASVSISAFGSLTGSGDGRASLGANASVVPGADGGPVLAGAEVCTGAGGATADEAAGAPSGARAPPHEGLTDLVVQLRSQVASAMRKRQDDEGELREREQDERHLREELAALRRRREAAVDGAEASSLVAARMQQEHDELREIHTATSAKTSEQEIELHEHREIAIKRAAEYRASWAREGPEKDALVMTKLQIAEAHERLNEVRHQLRTNKDGLGRQLSQLRAEAAMLRETPPASSGTSV